MPPPIGMSSGLGLGVPRAATSSGSLPAAGGGGGGYLLGPGYTITATPDMRFNVNDLSLNDDDVVEAWVADEGDYSLRSAASYQPIYKTGVINAGPGVYWDGDNAYLDLWDAAETTEVVFTLPSDNTNFFMVANFPSAFLGQKLQFRKVYGGYGASYIKHSSGGVYSQMAFVTNAGTNALGNNFHSDTGADLWFEFRQYDDGGTPKVAGTWQVDGGSVTTGAATLNAGDMEFSRIGYISTWPWTVYFAELLFFTTALSDADRTVVHNYLAATYLP